MLRAYKDEAYIGFQMTFENGNTISVMFGRGSMSSNRDVMNEQSPDAEVAIWNKDGKFFQGGTYSYCKSDEVAKYIHIAQLIEF